MCHRNLNGQLYESFKSVCLSLFMTLFLQKVIPSTVMIIKDDLKLFWNFHLFHNHTQILTLPYSHSHTHTHLLTLTYSHSHIHTHILKVTKSQLHDQANILTFTYSNFYSPFHTRTEIFTLTNSYSFAGNHVHSHSQTLG